MGVIAFGFGSAIALAGMDWRDTGTLYELIYRVLLLVIGVELIRTLVTHNLARNRLGATRFRHRA